MIEVRNLCKQYPGAKRRALDNLNFSVERGEFLVVLGRSGSGKTTLFRCLNRLIRPDSGTILICGQDLTQLEGHDLCDLRRSIATIFQQFNLVRRLSVLDNVLASRLAYIPMWRILFRHFPETQEQWSLHCLSRVGLLSLADRRADTLSGGEQQRVAIARALAQQPLVILADEPIASLDAESAAMVLTELQTIARNEGITIVCSLHQEDFALRYATQIIGLREGKMVVNVPCHRFGKTERDLIFHDIVDSTEQTPYQTMIHVSV